MSVIVTYLNDNAHDKHHLVDLFSPLGKVAGRAIYFTDVFSLFFLFFFNGRLSSQRS